MRMYQSNQSKAVAFRRKAATCARLAQCARSAADREHFLCLNEACLEQAASQEWLDGLPPLPPANANALRRMNYGSCAAMR
jgi:hypothetical protein